ncbi:peptidyl-prolyl cis-trans isomerase FKBP8 [Phlebotomus argentipes]|uniref:peptidyl-prolyl cis-trans isomerase FKBP8 n=1 Tax=Phlebotomus argentipes TaxID=94469 RepID=UPI002892FCA6|nr:peptidyl-prolyl cis-trans isomerase FKBP8 [Phlebotomus argentipes]
MDQDKSSSNSSFEDLTSTAAELDKMPEKAEEKEDDVMDILGNGQLTKRILVKGREEQKPLTGDVCRIVFEGRLEDGTLVEKEEDFLINVGEHEVCQGLDMTLALMYPGEKAEVVVSPRFAYGSMGLKNEKDPSRNIPPDSKIIYTVELLTSEPEDESQTKTFENRKKIGTRKRERGNFWFNRTEYNIAIQLYRRALEYLDDTEGAPETSLESFTTQQLQELLELRIFVFNNLAAAQTKIQAYDTALKSIENVLRVQPDNVKALYRKGKILEAQGDTNGAIAIFQRAATLDPENKSFQTELGKLILKRTREVRNEKDLYQKMLGHAQKLEQKDKRKSTCTVANWRPWGLLLGTVLVGVAGVAMYRYKYF